jgi:tetratricopeptide (TPR) repeat protein
MLRRSKSKAPSRRSRDLIPVEYVEAYIFRAVEMCKDGEVEGAVFALGKALSLDPESETALQMRGNLWMVQGHPRKAIGDLSKVLVLDCCNTAAYFRRAQAYQSLGHLRAALADYSRVLRLQADHREALINRAALYWCTHQIVRALSDFERLGSTDSRIMRALVKWCEINLVQNGYQLPILPPVAHE